MEYESNNLSRACRQKKEERERERERERETWEGGASRGHATSERFIPFFADDVAYLSASGEREGGKAGGKTSVVRKSISSPFLAATRDFLLQPFLGLSSLSIQRQCGSRSRQSL